VDSQPAEPSSEAGLKVAGQVKDIRRARHLSQRQLAGRMQVPRTYISKIENGKAIPHWVRWSGWPRRWVWTCANWYATPVACATTKWRRFWLIPCCPKSPPCCRNWTAAPLARLRRGARYGDGPPALGVRRAVQVCGIIAAHRRLCYGRWCNTLASGAGSLLRGVHEEAIPLVPVGTLRIDELTAEERAVYATLKPKLCPSTWPSSWTAMGAGPEAAR